MKKVLLLIVACLLFAGVTITATRNMPQADFPAGPTIQSSEDNNDQHFYKTRWNNHAY